MIETDEPKTLGAQVTYLGSRVHAPSPSSASDAPPSPPQSRLHDDAFSYVPFVVPPSRPRGDDGDVASPARARVPGLRHRDVDVTCPKPTCHDHLPRPHGDASHVYCAPN